MKLLGVTEYRTNYYSVGQTVLVAVMETSDDDRPLVVFARGPFGRTVWSLRDSFTDLRTPEQSTEIVPSTLPNPTPIPLNPIDPMGQSATVSGIGASDFSSSDGELRSVHGGHFSSWTDWTQWAYYLPFHYRAPFQRPRIVDMLVRLGILERRNALNVRHQTDPVHIKAAVKKFDALDDPGVVPVALLHLLPGDTSLNYTPAHFGRMSAAMAQFLADIGEPMEISDSAAQKRGLPNFRQKVPAFPCFDGFAIVLSPAMCTGSVDDFEKLTPPVRIVFNETDFDVNEKVQDGAQFVIVVRPAVGGRYFVRQVAVIPGRISPFAASQLLSANTIAFYVAMLIDMAIASRSVAGIEAKRAEIIGELCKGEAAMEFGPLASEVFA
jgi:hypothetical protein